MRWKRQPKRCKAATRQKDRIEALTQTVQAYEVGLAALREGLREAQLAEAAQTRALSDRSADLSRLLAVLMGTASLDDATVLAHPEGALARGACGPVACATWPRHWGPKWPICATRWMTFPPYAVRANTGFWLWSRACRFAQQARLALTQAIAERGPLPKRLSEDPDAMAALAASAASLDAFAQDLASRSPVLSDSATHAIRGFRKRQRAAGHAGAGQCGARFPAGRCDRRRASGAGYCNAAGGACQRAMGGHGALCGAIGRAWSGL